MDGFAKRKARREFVSKRGFQSQVAQAQILALDVLPILPWVNY